MSLVNDAQSVLFQRILSARSGPMNMEIRRTNKNMPQGGAPKRWGRGTLTSKFPGKDKLTGFDGFVGGIVGFDAVETVVCVAFDCCY